MVFASRGRVLSYANQHVVADLGVGRILLPLSVARDPAKHHSILLESEAFAAAHDARGLGERVTSPSVFQRAISRRGGMPGRHGFHWFVALGFVGGALELGVGRAHRAVCICDDQCSFRHHVAGCDALFLPRK